MADLEVHIRGRFTRVVKVQGNTAADMIAAAKMACEDAKRILDAANFVGVEFSTDDLSADEAGVCPLCGESVKYGERESMDEGGVYFWTCPNCGATGREGYNETFDGHHYNVRDRDGRPIPDRDE